MSNQTRQTCMQGKQKHCHDIKTNMSISQRLFTFYIIFFFFYLCVVFFFSFFFFYFFFTLFGRSHSLPLCSVPLFVSLCLETDEWSDGWMDGDDKCVIMLPSTNHICDYYYTYFFFILSFSFFCFFFAFLWKLKR